MQIFLVGGAVRDLLLQQLGHTVSPSDKDWVVVGSSPEEMIRLGFKPVGHSFPVFLHPKTHEEYALARTERKTSHGYHGFSFFSDPDVSLEKDLMRRDLTINAMAMSPDGHIIDPFGGRDDLRNKILRHVSPAFSEDPVRLLRVARFAARFPDFTIASETKELLKEMVNTGEADHLTSERVWAELSRGLQETAPKRMAEVLCRCGFWQRTFPEASVSPIVLASLDRASGSVSDLATRSCLLFSGLSEEKAKMFCRQHKFPSDIADAITFFAKNYKKMLLARTAEDYFSLLGLSDAIRRPKRIACFLQTLCCFAPDFNPKPMDRAIKAYRSINVADLLTTSQKDVPLAVRIQQARLSAVRNTLL